MEDLIKRVDLELWKKLQIKVVRISCEKKFWQKILSPVSSFWAKTLC